VFAGQLAGLRVGIGRTHFFDGLMPDVAAAVIGTIDALGRHGSSMVAFELPDSARGLGAIFAIELASSTNYHDQRLRAGVTVQFAEDVRLLVEMGRLVNAADYLQAERFRRRLGVQVAALFDEIDVMVGPTLH
jgi:aspartyl-tRNA(Asn)/glutamyl-tRNA(Gln) amidotransferase subunit A